MVFQTSLEHEVANLKAKVQSLQIDLDNSEAVQRDFVKLSQSLQVYINYCTKSQQLKNLLGYYLRIDCTMNSIIYSSSGYEKQLYILQLLIHMAPNGKLL